MSHLAEFLECRDRLLGVARRIVGGDGDGDAEDVVQDAWLRWDRTDRQVVRNVPAFLTSTTTRLSINARQTAHVRHRDRDGLAWLDRPDRTLDPASLVERSEELRAAMGLLVERLNPRERVAYVLREAFGYPHRQIADALGLSEANARQLTRRARMRLRVTPGVRPDTTQDRRELLGAFHEVSRTGNPAALAAVAAGCPAASRHAAA